VKSTTWVYRSWIDWSVNGRAEGKGTGLALATRGSAVIRGVIDDALTLDDAETYTRVQEL
jgi:hypothetical protein